MTSLKIVALSDTHEHHERLQVPPGDILIHGGDFTNWGELENIARFNEWLGTLPHRHKVVIAGNHDFGFEKKPEEARSLLTNCIYLEDSFCILEGIKIYGSPWQPKFGFWAFNVERGEKIREKWNLIPPDVNILITHGPPYGIGDLTDSKRQVGCRDLLEAILRIRPRYHIFGHIHEGAGIYRKKETTFINASSFPDSHPYEESFGPVVFDYEIL